MVGFVSPVSDPFTCSRLILTSDKCVCVCVCVWERERERDEMRFAYMCRKTIKLRCGNPTRIARQKCTQTKGKSKTSFCSVRNSFHDAPYRPVCGFKSPLNTSCWSICAASSIPATIASHSGPAGLTFLFLMNSVLICSLDTFIAKSSPLNKFNRARFNLLYADKTRDRAAATDDILALCRWIWDCFRRAWSSVRRGFRRTSIFLDCSLNTTEVRTVNTGTCLLQIGTAQAMHSVNFLNLAACSCIWMLANEGLNHRRSFLVSAAKNGVVAQISNGCWIPDSKKFDLSCLILGQGTHWAYQLFVTSPTTHTFYWQPCYCSWSSFILILVVGASSKLLTTTATTISCCLPMHDDVVDL